MRTYSKSESIRIIPLSNGDYYTTEIFSNNYLIHASDDMKFLNQTIPMVINGQLHYSSQLLSDISGAIEKDLKGILVVMKTIHPEYIIPTFKNEHKDAEYSHNIYQLYKEVNSKFINVCPVKTIAESNKLKMDMYYIGKEYRDAKYSEKPPIEALSTALDLANIIDKNTNKFIDKKYKETLAILEQTTTETEEQNSWKEPDE